MEMSTAEEAEQERAVFEDDDDDDDDDDSDDSEDDEDDGEGQADAPPPPPQAQTVQPVLSSAASGDLNSSAPSHDTANPNPNLTPNLNPVLNPTLSDPATGPPQNGAIPVQILPVASVALSSDASLFNPSSSVHIPVSTVSSNDERRSLAVVAFDDSRRLFQRLWTDEEEIRILQGFYEFTSRRGTTFASHQYDTGPFYEEIKKQLQFDFTKNQLIEKLRRLKKKYRNCVSRMQAVGKDFAFKSAHERAIYDIARKIWSASTKRAHESDDEDLNTTNTAISNEIITVPINDGSLSSDRRSSRSRRRMRRRMMEEDVPVDATTPVGGVAVDNSTPVVHTPLASAAEIPNIVEETVKSCLSPLFKELINSAIGGPLGPGLSSGTSPLNLLPLSLGGGSLADPGMPVDEKWRKQQILELEVYLKRLELVKDHIKSTLEQLKSSGS
ncbi:putative transcription factor [Canna indica]|uniref:Transcription factor n=1 Tax=Canna indica TaxID=4628 RepID=A0AAQ3QDA2_9LILI|nr:putative transcription factor [Canna indica]